MDTKNAAFVIFSSVGVSAISLVKKNPPNLIDDIDNDIFTHSILFRWALKVMEVFQCKHPKR